MSKDQDSELIKHLYNHGKIIALNKCLQEGKESISDEMKLKIQEEWRYFQDGQSRLTKDIKTMKEIHHDPSRNLRVYIPPDNQPGFMGYQFLL